MPDANKGYAESVTAFPLNARRQERLLADRRRLADGVTVRAIDPGYDPSVPDSMARSNWPALDLRSWSATRDTLQLWLQIVGKVRLVQTPWVNHSWHATLYVTSRGLTTSPIPHANGTFQIDFDFTDHRLVATTCDGRSETLPLEPQTVADFYRRVMGLLTRLDVPVRIVARPNEVASPIPFAEDTVHAAYDPDAVHRFWRALVETQRVMLLFRARYRGKCSPVHLFWGAMDLAVTRFSGRPAPPHPGGVPALPDTVAREAYSHEVSSCGFWTGAGAVDYPAFYAYAYPEPPGFADAPVAPKGAFYSPDFREFILPYEHVRASADPDETLLTFLQSTYEAAANLGGWDRTALERVGDTYGP